MTRLSKWMAALAVVLTSSLASAQEARKIDFAEAIQLATTENSQVALGREAIVVAEQDVAATKTIRLPSLMVKANVFVWNDEISLSFAPGAALDPTMFTEEQQRIVLPVLGALFPADAPATVVREQITASAEVTIAQPITAAIVLGTLIDIRKLGVDVSRAELDVTKLDLAYQAAELYLRVLQAQTLRDVTATSVTQIEANLERARALRQAEILGDVDILRLEAQRDQIRQQILEADNNAETAKRALALQLGLPDGTRLELAPIDPAPPPIAMSEDDAAAAARKQRPELRAAAARARQAELGIKVRRAEYLPSVNAVASYTRNEGQGSFGAKDAAFIGLALDWKIWDWGERKAHVSQARSQARQARIGEELAEDGLAVDVRSKWLTAASKRETIAVAESGLKAAEEAHRLQNVRFAEGAATTTDVINAEAEVAQARARATIARYDYLIAWMALGRAVGEVPSIPRSP